MFENSNPCSLDEKPKHSQKSAILPTTWSLLSNLAEGTDFKIIHAIVVFVNYFAYKSVSECHSKI